MTDIILPPTAQRVTPHGMPPCAWWNCSAETPWKIALPDVILHPHTPLPDALAQELRRAYLGAVSWMDHGASSKAHCFSPVLRCFYQSNTYI